MRSRIRFGFVLVAIILAGFFVVGPTPANAATTTISDGKASCTFSISTAYVGSTLMKKVGTITAKNNSSVSMTVVCNVYRSGSLVASEAPYLAPGKSASHNFSSSNIVGSSFRGRLYDRRFGHDIYKTL